MSELPKLGKINPEFFNKFIYPKLGNPDPSIIIKPQSGVDFGAIDLGDKVMVLSPNDFRIWVCQAHDKCILWMGRDSCVLDG